jgi:hypothetical protein
MQGGTKKSSDRMLEIVSIRTHKDVARPVQLELSEEQKPSGRNMSESLHQADVGGRRAGWRQGRQ